MKILFDFAIFITMFSSTIASPCDESELSTTTGEMSGDYCAAENEICVIGGDTMKKGQIRYGDSATNRFSNWKDITSEDGFFCSIRWENDNSGFGMDPYNDQVKNCYWREGPSDFEKEADKKKKLCGKHGSSCQCTGGQQARYGYDGGGGIIGERWTNWIDIEETFNCNWDSFGGFDPARSRHKVCECRPTPPPPLTPSKIAKEYQGRWIEIGYGLDEFSVTAQVTVEESVSETVGEVFVKGYGVSATVTVGYEPPVGGVSGSVSVTTEMSETYEQSTSHTMSSTGSTTNEVSCGAKVCDGVLYQWEVRAFDQFSKVAASVGTCKFVCVPHKKSDGSKLFPSCPDQACNLKENCTCCAVKWSDDTDVDQKLCVDRPLLQLNGAQIDFSKSSDPPIDSSATEVSLTDNSHAEIDATTLGNFGSSDFSIEFTFSSPGGDITPDGSWGALFIRSVEITKPYTGPSAFIHNNGSIQFRMLYAERMTCQKALPSKKSGAYIRKLKFEKSGSTIILTIDGVEECRKEMNPALTIDASKFVTAPLRFGGAQNRNVNKNNLRATLSNIKLVGDTSRRRRLGGTKSAILLAE
mmetsp:Transcript_10179/g.11605  ORF Transcript_10179/g.11605 Transcript_10179/m.11605 type:complete len:583 (+) Transcript_10179:231-1979(+)